MDNRAYDAKSLADDSAPVLIPEIQAFIDRARSRQLKTLRNQREPLPQITVAIIKAARTPCKRGDTFLYFARCFDFVKVGVSAQPLQRLDALNYTSPFQIEFMKVMAGTHAGEAAVHCVLRPYHHRFEWFRLDQDLKDAIRRLPGVRRARYA